MRRRPRSCHGSARRSIGIGWDLRPTVGLPAIEPDDHFLRLGHASCMLQKTRRGLRALHLGATLGLVGFVAISAVSRADPPDIVAGMRACAKEQDDSRRLACYDRSVGRIPVELPQSAVSKPQPPPVPSGPEAAALAEQQFGMNPQLARQQADAPAMRQLKELRARVVAVSRKPRGEPIVTLENGQIWQAADGEVTDRFKVGDVVTIWTGTLGAYYMAVRHDTVRVTRVR